MEVLRLQILFQDRHFEREAALIGEHHADELVADMQVGRVGLGRTRRTENFSPSCVFSETLSFATVSPSSLGERPLPTS